MICKNQGGVDHSPGFVVGSVVPDDLPRFFNAAVGDSVDSMLGPLMTLNHLEFKLYTNKFNK